MTSIYANNSKSRNLSTYGTYPTPIPMDPQTGAPMEGQIARTYETYNLTGNQTFTDLLQGSNNVNLSADLALGNITISITNQGIRNLVGRKVDIVSKPANDGGLRFVLINLPAGVFYSYQGAAFPLVKNSLQLPITLVSLVSLNFVTPTEVVILSNPTSYTLLP